MLCGFYTLSINFSGRWGGGGIENRILGNYQSFRIFEKILPLGIMHGGGDDDEKVGKENQVYYLFLN